MSGIKEVMAINPHAVDELGNLKPFLEQYGEFSLQRELDPSAGNLDRFSPFVLSMDCAVYGIAELEGKPLVLTNQAIKHMAKKHRARIDGLQNLAAEMRGNLLVYGDPQKEGNLVFVLPAYSENGHRIISIVNASLEIGRIEIASIRSVHGKRDLDGEISRAFKVGRPVYVNERTGDWLRDPRTLPAEAELSSETSQRLLGLYYRAFPERRPAGPAAPAPSTGSIRAALSGRAIAAPGAASGRRP